jgi:phosphotransferase system enzyme I (PtsI)
VSKKNRKKINLAGIGVSPGVAMGTAEVYNNELEDVAVYPIEPEHIQDEIERYLGAVETVRGYLLESAAIVSEKIGTQEAGIFNAQILLLDSTLFKTTIPRAIKKELVNVEAILLRSLKEFQKAHRTGDSEESRKGHADVKDIHRQIIHLLVEKNPQCIILYDTVILAAREFLPSDLALFPPGQVLGLVSETGGMNAHAAIMARSSGIPAVMGVDKASHYIANGDFIIIDGTTGEVLINPDPALEMEYTRKIEQERTIREGIEALIDFPSETTDGVQVALLANISRPQDVGQAKRWGAAGIGLFRTEIPFLMGEHFIAEDEQFELYRQVIVEMEHLPVTIRTLDLGGDKVLTQEIFNQEPNPFLGLRSIRFSLRYQDIFITQLRAILRASQFGHVKILFPMVTSIDELALIVDIYRKVREDIEREGTRPHTEPTLGVMIEVPSSALMAESFLEEFDFASIGTNDLIQYTLAVDRGNKSVSHLYSPYNPAVLRLIEMTAQAGKKAKKEVSVCGEMAADPVSAVLLIGMGIHVLSMEPRHLLRIKETVISISQADAEAAAKKALTMKTAREVEQFITARFDLPKGD